MRGSKLFFKFLLPVMSLPIVFALAGASWAAESKFEVGLNHTVILRANGTMWACGDNSFGQLGEGTTTARLIPVRIGTATDWADVTAGAFHTVAIKKDGTMWAWGDNTSGQLGDGLTAFGQVSPKQVGTDNTWKKVVSHYNHTIALKTDGSLWAWGESYSGQVGTGEVYPAMLVDAVPVKIGSDADWVDLYPGELHSLALKADGTIWGWGSNFVGQLGLDEGLNFDFRGPTRVGADSDWSRVYSGRTHTIINKANGSLYMMGLNDSGQLGNGSLANAYVPTRVGSDNDWSPATTAGDAHTLALKTNGSLWAWGDNGNGQLGDGTLLSRTVPVQIGADTDWVELEAKGNCSMAMKSGGTLWSWGDNSFGQLVNGSTISKNVPSPAITPISGDLDVDGRVTIADALRSLRIVVNLVTPTEIDLITAPLAWESRTMSIADALLILRKTVGLPSF
jgi:trimeric autotransporter adhesin